MATRRALKSINWGALAERIPESERNAYSNLKAKYDQYFRLVQENPETAPKIDWAFYKDKIALPGLVDKFQKEYESLKVDYPQDKYTSQLDSYEKKVEEHIEKFKAESNQRIEEYKSKITKLEGLLKYGQMTMEDFKDAHPDLALDPLNRPTIFPHFPEYQPGPDDHKEKSHH